ncbi:hypothetical protein [Streptomyces albidoflavus]|uniref:hypothetical protein n=1 Tax=Streptomyces albidoflavus TaxID=1886 RepID=UPI003D1073D8
MSTRATDAWARALTAAVTTAADTGTVHAARRLLAAETTQLNVNQGFATAKFHLPTGRPVRPRLLVEELSTEQWKRIETALAARPSDHGLSDELTDPAHTAGIPLIPSAQDFSHTCPCTPATGPCPHTVAVGLLLAERLRSAAEPLFTFRGRAYHRIRKAVRTAKPGDAFLATSPGAAPQSDHPAPAPAVLIPAQQQPPTPIPEPVDLDLTAAHPVLPAGPPPPPAPLPGLAALGALVDDAAHRAQALLDRSEQPAGPDAGTDLARFTALEHGATYRQAAMEQLGLDTVTMGHLSLAHTHGGTAGAAAYLHRYDLDHDGLARAQAAIQPLRPAPTAIVECEDNRLTDQAAGVQLRYGPDGRWHPYFAPYGTWQPAPGPSPDPALAYQAARAAARPHRRIR